MFRFGSVVMVTQLAGNTASPDLAACLLEAVSVPPVHLPDWPEVVTPPMLQHFCASESAWEAAGGRAAEIVASMGLDEPKTQLCEQAAAIFEGKAAQIQPEDRQYALWAAYGVIVAVLAGGSAKRTDLRLLCKPFAQLLRETPIPAPGENTYCETHPRVPLTYGGCHVCRRGDDKRYSR